MKAKVIVVEGSLAEVLEILKEIDRSDREQAEGSAEETSTGPSEPGNEHSRNGSAVLVANGHSLQNSPRPCGILSKRERVIVLRVADGSTDKVIGAELGIAHTTVKTHIRNITNKLGLDNRTQVAVWSREHQLELQ